MRYVFMLLLAFSSISPAVSQVSAVLNIIMNDYSLSGTNLWFLSITNASSSAYNCYIHATLSVPNEGIIGNGTSKSFILAPFETKINSKNGADLTDSNTVDYDKTYREWYERTNELPSRKYTICIEVIETGTGQLLAKTCQDLEPQKYRPPVNIYPLDRDTVPGSNLSFQWLPSQPYNQDFTYSIRIVEVLSIQSPVAAFYSNNFFFTEDNLKVPVLQYPVNARRLEVGKPYAWLIEGRLDKLVVKSEPTVFVVENTAMPAQPPIIRQPGRYMQYIDLMSPAALETQFVRDGTIPLMLDNRGAPYNLFYCITGSSEKILKKGTVPVAAGLNKLLLDANGLKAGKDQIYYLNLFRAGGDLPVLRFTLADQTSKK